MKRFHSHITVRGEFATSAAKAIKGKVTGIVVGSYQIRHRGDNPV